MAELHALLPTQKEMTFALLECLFFLVKKNLLSIASPFFLPKGNRQPGKTVARGTIIPASFFSLSPFVSEGAQEPLRLTN